MKYEWKQTIFKPEDFDGSGQYIIREPINKLSTNYISDSGYLSTIMMKVGYSVSNKKNYVGRSIYCLIDMSDGLVKEGYYTNTNTDKGKPIDVEKWIWNEFSGNNNYEAKIKLCEYLNNNPFNQTFRFATNEELVRVVMHQRNYRTKG